jgi:hypothetical protein
MVSSQTIGQLRQVEDLVSLQDFLQYKQLQNCTISNSEAIESLLIKVSNPFGKNMLFN